MNESENQFSFTRAASSTSGRARKQIPAISSVYQSAGSRLAQAIAHATILQTCLLALCITNASAQIIGSPSVSARQAVTLIANLGLYPINYGTNIFHQLIADGVLTPTPFAVPTGSILVITDMDVLSLDFTTRGAALWIGPLAGGTTNRLTGLWSTGPDAHVTFLSGFTVSSKAAPLVTGSPWVTVTLTGYLAADPMPSLSVTAAPQSSSQITSAGFQLDVTGSPTDVISVYASRDLKTWSSVARTEIPPSGVLQVTDMSATNAPQMFYRASY